MILIGGMNGSGKTTISEAIKLCLYGSRASGTPLSDSRHQDYISDVWSKGHLDEDMRISMDITVDVENLPMNLTISRRFVSTRSGFNERLSLTKDGKDVELIDRNYWEYYIGKILPPHISRYFFFDGETTRDIIASDGSPEYLYEAIRDLTGITQLDTLKRDLQEVRRRISRSNVKPAIRKKIESLESRISEIDSSIEFTKNELISSDKDKKKLISHRDQLNDEFNRALGIKEKVTTGLKKTLSLEKVRYAELNDHIQEFVYSCYPKIICADVFEDTLAVAKRENDRNIQTLSYDYVCSKVLEIKRDLKNMHLNEEEFTEVCEIIDETFFAAEDAGDHHPELIVDLTYRQIDAIRSDECTDETKCTFIDTLREREVSENTITKIEKKLSRYSDDSYEHFNERIDGIDRLIEKCDEEILEKNILIRINEEEKRRIEEEILNEERNLILSARDSSALNVIEEVLKNIDARSDARISESIEDLEININRIHSVLKNKKDMIKAIKIQPDHSLKLIGRDAAEMKVHLLSEGEKGILMYSVVYGLLSMSQSKLPLIIDSPLGRMDSEHVKKLVKELYPIFGNQVIILSHDREITSEYARLIDPMLSKKYTLHNTVPKITSGYFE